jgi:hypothetical protein
MIHQHLPDHPTEGCTALAELSEDDRYRLLASAHRRAALAALAERTAPVDLEDLAREVAAFVRDDDAGIDEVALRLHHVHLPKMVELGVLDYDPETSRVVPCR